jgi:hypothetical protein
MVTDYIGDVVINAESALSYVIDFYQREDKTMYERLREMRDSCLRHGWQPNVAERTQPTESINRP